MVDSRLPPTPVHNPSRVLESEQNLVGINAVVLALCYLSMGNGHITNCFINMQIKKFGKVGHVVFGISSHTEPQTDTLITVLRIALWGEVM